MPSFGDFDAGLVIVGLAPAAHGANRTGRMFTGDRSGEWLYRALHKSGFANQPDSTHGDDGLALSGAYITAAAHCAPPDNKPTTAELSECSHYLATELDYFLARVSAKEEPLVLLALGGIAFSSVLGYLRGASVPTPTPKPRFSHLAEVGLSPQLTLLASYHPSQQNTQTGRLTEPMFDAVFERARTLLEQGCG